MKVINRLNDDIRYKYNKTTNKIDVFDSNEDYFIASFLIFENLKNYNWAFLGYQGSYRLIKEVYKITTVNDSILYAHNISFRDSDTVVKAKRIERADLNEDVTTYDRLYIRM